MADILFMRHGEADNVVRHICAGRQWDCKGLSEQGHAQALAAGRYLAEKNEPIAEIWCSPILRTRQTLQGVLKGYQELSSVPVVYRTELEERGYGDFEGLPRSQEMDDFIYAGKTPPNGESDADFKARVRLVFDEASVSGKTVLLVSHGGVWFALHGIQNTLARRPKLHPADVHRVDYLRCSTERVFSAYND